MEIEEIIARARSSLPAAFFPRHAQPPNVIDQASPVPADLDLALPESLEETSESQRDELADAYARFYEGGFEAFACYHSFHYAAPGQKWGICYYRTGVRQLALMLMRDWESLKGKDAEHNALGLLRAHERYHFRVDFSTLHEELLLRTPLYRRYSEEVYKSVVFTSDCFEESLANEAMIHAAPDLWVPSRRDALQKELVRGAVKELCKNGPPGYRDFERPADEMRERLLGQIRMGKADGRIEGAEPAWLGTNIQTDCPEYLIVPANLTTTRYFKCKTGGRIWIIHKNDADPWPSQPHAHDYSNREKLHLGSGHLFSVSTKKQVGKFPQHHLEALRNEISRRRPELRLPTLEA